MPIRLPVKTTILTSDFRDQVYSFTVESVIMLQERGGLLTVSTSKGYLLTSSLDKELKREQTVKHIQQTDGSWLASATITLKVAGNSAVDGVIIIRNPLNETLLLTIDATVTSLELVQKPTLTFSHPELVFPQTSSDKPSFLILTITQQHSETPITLTTDAPEYFQLASDKRPAFLPTLTLTPSAIGTYVHIRYAASKNGRHVGILTVKNQFETRTVTLGGRTAGLLPAFRQRTLRPPSRPVKTKRWMKILASAFIGGLTYTGYINRCQLIPALCHEPAISQISSQANELLQVSEKVAINSVGIKRFKEKQSLKIEQSDQKRLINSEPAAKQTNTDEADQEPTSEAAFQPEVQKKSIKQESNEQLERQHPQRRTTVTSTDESELERMLNQKP